MIHARRGLWGLVLVFAVVAPLPLLADTATDWQPAKTWVFTVGLLKWEHSDLWPAMPAARQNRRDKQLVEYFRNAGVPDNQIEYLSDDDATKSRIGTSFHSLLEKTNDGDLLVFYFCGHGYRDQQTGRTYFANYDAGKRASGAWEVSSIFESIHNRFRGNRVLMLADCCHSGALYDYAHKQNDSHIAFAVLTSSYAHNTSTGNWTFSDSVLSGLRGDPLVDLNRDGVVDLQEVARFAELELAFVDGQKSMFFVANRFPKDKKLSSVRVPAKQQVGQRIEVNYQGKWYKAKTIQAANDKLQIHYVGYDNSWDEWVGTDRIRPYEPDQFGVGDKVSVRWQVDGKWYPASVIETWYGLHLVHYDGYDASWDEWVGPGAIQLRLE